MNDTAIEWTEKTWSPVTGCSPVSAGCDHCYARRMAHRLRGRFGYPADEPFRVTLHPERLREPFYTAKHKRIFVCSMGDLFHPDVPDDFLDEVFFPMYVLNVDQVFILLTKRPERMRDYLSRKPPLPPTVWLGVSCENQAAADERIPILLQTPATVRFVSVEPMLSEVDLSPWFGLYEYENRRWALSVGSRWKDSPDWIVCGGETGPGARPVHPDWVRSLRDQATAAGVAFYFKGWGQWWPSGRRIVENAQMVMFGNEPMYRVGKKRSGRLLDGRIWDEYPSEARFRKEGSI